MNSIEERLAKLLQTRDEQCKDGTWDHSPYMRGLANGLILAHSILTDTEPNFKQIPDRWVEHDMTPLPSEGHSQQLPPYAKVKLVVPSSVKFQPVP